MDKNALAVTYQKTYEEEVKEMEDILDTYAKNILALIERTRNIDNVHKKQKEYSRVYYIKNREKCNEANKRYKLNNAEKIKEYRLNNAEKKKEYNRVYYRKNKKVKKCPLAK
jgi:hypothetical protein